MSDTTLDEPPRENSIGDVKMQNTTLTADSLGERTLPHMTLDEPMVGESMGDVNMQSMTLTVDTLGDGKRLHAPTGELEPAPGYVQLTVTCSDGTVPTHLGLGRGTAASVTSGAVSVQTNDEDGQQNESINEDKAI